MLGRGRRGRVVERRVLGRVDGHPVEHDAAAERRQLLGAGHVGEHREADVEHRLAEPLGQRLEVDALSDVAGLAAEAQVSSIAVSIAAGVSCARARAGRSPPTAARRSSGGPPPGAEAPQAAMASHSAVILSRTGFVPLEAVERPLGHPRRGRSGSARSARRRSRPSSRSGGTGCRAGCRSVRDLLERGAHARRREQPCRRLEDLRSACTVYRHVVSQAHRPDGDRTFTCNEG